MKNKIIEIVEIGLPKSLIQRENEPITELIETNLLVEELNEALRLFAVVGRSEQCVLHSPDWFGKCFKCGEQVFVREEK
jgi:hypothetical protein